MQEQSLGDYHVECQRFTDDKDVIEDFINTDFSSLSTTAKKNRVSKKLYQLVNKAPQQSFLLTAVVAYIDKINQNSLLPKPYHINDFEFWLNHTSNLNDEEQQSIRGKIVGKLIPREDYQVFFPIGMNKKFYGTHFVAAHKSPDIDTMVASFWGWADAFAARIGTGQHCWSLPGGPPESPITKLFQAQFGEESFKNLSQFGSTLRLSAMDLVTQDLFLKAKGDTLVTDLDHGRSQWAIILIDDDGYYLGDWSSLDAEHTRKVTILYKSALHWFENHLHLELIKIFGHKNLLSTDVPAAIDAIFSRTIESSSSVEGFNDRQKKLLDQFLKEVLHIEEGLSATFDHLKDPGLQKIKIQLKDLTASDLFDSKGALKEDRSLVLHHLEKVFRDIDTVIHDILLTSERLDTGVNIKTKVLNKKTQYITLTSDLEDVKTKMEGNSHLTVVSPNDTNGKLYPLGVVRDSDLKMRVLGTVSLRDFCNDNEVQMADYLTVISVIDHHKSSLNTISPPSALIGDTQSCNVLIAEQTFQLNDRYSLGGMTEEALNEGMLKLEKTDLSRSQTRLHYKLLQRKLAQQQNENNWIHPVREYLEYLFILHAILDDTDLLTKVSNRDILCVVQLINRMKSLSLGQEVEVINLDDIPLNSHFAKKGAEKILQNKEMYSLYEKIYRIKEQEMEDLLKGHQDGLFGDTKEQNGCCRIGQIKRFFHNIATYDKKVATLQKVWLDEAQAVHRARSEFDLHIMMISTIPSAKDVYEGRDPTHDHKDELWIWIPKTPLAEAHLTNFLNALSTAVEVRNNTFEVSFLGDNRSMLEDIFERSFPHAKIIDTDKMEETDLPIAVLRFKAGSLNSRKSMISPYLPKFIP